MKTSEIVWSGWIAELKSRGYASFAASLMDAFKPISFIAAQVVYVGSPLLNLMISPGSMNAAAELLENDNKYNNFLCQLKTGDDS